MPVRRREVAVELLHASVVVCAAASIVVYAAVAITRMRYRFELEWLEGGSVEEVRRLVGGQPLYARPTIDFVPGNYPPLYFYVSAVVAKVFGVGFFSLRLVSFAASLGVFALIAALIRHETHTWWAGIVASGLYAACYRIGGAWFDVARVDSLFLLAVIASIYVVRITKSWPYVVLAALLVVLATFTKQNAVFVACGLFVYLLHRRRQWAALYGTLVSGLSLVATGVWNTVTHGWFWYYNYDVTGIHAVLTSRIAGFWLHDLLSHLALAVLVSGGYLVWLRVTNQHDALWFYLPVVASLVFPAWYVRIHDGAYANDVLPAYLALALLFGLGLHAFTRSPIKRTWRSGAAIVVLLAAVVQFALLRYNPVAQLPTAADEHAGQQLLSLLRHTHGDVLVADHPYYAALVGKHTFADSVWVSAVLDSNNRAAQRDVDRSFEAAVRAQRYGAVLLGPSARYVLAMAPDFDSYYRNATPAYFPPAALTPLTGGPVPLRTIYLPRK
jgi:4-amino-4-deoxy-L-arabinose transferase-like glycosyltransferase